MDIKLTVEDIDLRLQRLEAASVEKSRPQLSLEKVKDAQSLHNFLNAIRGKEEEYVSKTLYMRLNDTFSK